MLKNFTCQKIWVFMYRIFCNINIHHCILEIILKNVLVYNFNFDNITVFHISWNWLLQPFASRPPAVEVVTSTDIQGIHIYLLKVQIRLSIVNPYKLRHRRRISATLAGATFYVWAGARPGVPLPSTELRPLAPPEARRSRLSSRYSAVSGPFLDPNGRKIWVLRARNA